MKRSQLLSVCVLTGLVWGCVGAPPAESVSAGPKPSARPSVPDVGEKPSSPTGQPSSRPKPPTPAVADKNQPRNPAKPDPADPPSMMTEDPRSAAGMGTTGMGTTGMGTTGMGTTGMGTTGMGTTGSPSSGDDRVALVNGQPITRRELVERLLLSEGAKLLDLMVETELARQMARRGGATLDAADREQFLLGVMRAKYRQEGRPDLAALPDDQLRGLWAKTLEKVDRITGELAMERMYCLDRLARQNLAVSDAELREEFDRTFGEKVRFRCIMVENRSEAGELLRRLQGGDDFAETAKRVSRYPNAANGGLCDPVSVSLMPENVRAEMTKLKPLELTPPVVLEGKWFLFQLMERTPAQSVEYRQVADQLRSAVEEKKVQTGIKRLMLEIQKAKLEVTYYDDRLRLPGEER